MSYVVENITSREVNTKFGPKPAFTVVANGERFSYGFKKPAFAIGDEIDFHFTENTYGKNVDVASLRVIKRGSGGATPILTSAAPTAPSRGSYTPPAKVFPIPPLHGDRAIVRQNSITNATKAVVDMLSSSKSKDSLEFDSLAETIISMARKFEAYSCGDLDAELAEKMVEND